LALGAVQFSAMVTAADFPGTWSAGAVHTHDQLPGTLDGQTETDHGEGEVEELALGQENAFRVDRLARLRVLDNASCPQSDFALDLFRPPALS
jgi:hypothetical protein